MLKVLISSALILSLLSFAPGSLAGGTTAVALQNTDIYQTPQAGSVLALGSMETFETALVDALGYAQAGSPNVIILPQASVEEDSGLEEKQAFEAMGITDVYILKDLSTEGSKDLLKLASVIWLAQGSPKQLMQKLASDNMASFIPRMNDHGAIIGGAGRVAGALGIGYVEGNIKPPVMTSLSVMPNRGMGLWNGFVIPCMDEDDRLITGLTACLDQPNRPGIAFNHGSAVRINGDNMSFLGSGSSIFVDARKAKKRRGQAQVSHSIQDVKLHSFTDGDTFAWFQ